MFQRAILPIHRAEQPFVPCGETFLCGAEREMAAFVAAAEELHGSESGQLAGECWLEQLNKTTGSNRWDATLRQVTIAAAFQMAKSTAEDASKPSRPIIDNHSSKTGRTLPTSGDPLNRSFSQDALHTIGRARNVAADNRPPTNRSPSPHLVSKHSPKAQEYPASTLREEPVRLGDDLITPEPPAISQYMSCSLSHDIRNHLCAVYASVELMTYSTESQTEREELLQDIQATIRSAIDILDSPLSNSQPDHALSFHPHPLNQLIAQVLKTVRMHPDARYVKLSVAEYPVLNACIDRTELGRAIYNLLLNACQASNQASAPGHVYIGLREGRSSIQIRVTDNGLGVPEQIRKAIRHPSSRTDSNSTIGLGLTIAQCAAREHGGFVELEESTLGNTVFVLHIPKARNLHT